jgi:hypothetical protein
MQICSDHFHELKNAIRQRGLWELVTPDGFISTKSAKNEIDTEMSVSVFDPLVATSLMISEQALRAFGSYLLTSNFCPLCEVEGNLGNGMALEWIAVDTDAVLRFCIERNFLGSKEA